MMKTIGKVSNTVATKPETTISMKSIEFAPKKIWLPLVLGASLVYMGTPLYAAGYQGSDKQSTGSESTQRQGGKWGLRQGTERQGAGRGTSPGGSSMERGINRMEQGVDRMKQEINPRPGSDTRPGSEPMERGTTPGSEPMERGTTPGSEPMERGTTPGSDTMERGTTPGSDNINRDSTSPGGDNMMRDAIPGGEGMDRE